MTSADVLELPAAPPAPTHYLHAGNLYVSAGPAVVTTILGSCVAVCMWDQDSRIGGINHFLLPTPFIASQPSPRFGTHATQQLIEKLLGLGANLRSLRAKVFGGASVLSPGSGAMAVGLRNGEMACELLRARGIPILASSLGGTRGRKVIFHTGNGETFVKVI